MRHLYFVVDGERDFGVMPALVEGILGAPFEQSCDCWRYLRLNRPFGKAKRRGLGHKLLFATVRAQERGADGVVATVDRDKGESGRLKRLQNARKRQRQKAPPFPTALGEANPHAEAWLLDDPVAVRRTLEIEADAEIPRVTDVVSPKKALDDLVGSSQRGGERVADVLADVARAVDPGRCTHGKQTGFRAFEKNVEEELRPLFA